MREYVLNQSQSRQHLGRWTVLARVVRNWRQRRDLKRLRAMDDWMLRDIGITRAALEKFVAAPLTTDFEWERDRHFPR